MPGTYAEAIEAYSVLAPLARGNGIVEHKDVTNANDSIIRLSERFDTSFPPRVGDASKISGGSFAERMLFEPIREIKGLDTGVAFHANGALTIVFESGLKAVFKPLNRELQYSGGGRNPNWTAFKNEVNAFHFWDVVRQNLPWGGRSNPLVFVPETVEAVVRHNGHTYGIGSLQVFLEGFETLESLQNRNYGLFQQVMSTPQIAVARLAKNTFGDFDTFPNSKNNVGNLKNVMIETDGNGGVRWYGQGNVKIALIDNGIGRLEGPEAFEFSPAEAPHESHIPGDWKEAFRKIEPNQLGQFYRDRRALHHGGIDDLMGRLMYHQGRF